MQPATATRNHRAAEPTPHCAYQDHARYDNMGNQTQLSVSAGTVATYDGENRMSQIKVGTSVIASYTYDAAGRRVAEVCWRDRWASVVGYSCHWRDGG
jgi:YD repeat-containing protein